MLFVYGYVIVVICNAFESVRHCWCW